MTTTATVCASCGAAPSRVGARFCDACGSPIEAAATAAEFKQVTVLFADVVHMCARCWRRLAAKALIIKIW